VILKNGNTKLQEKEMNSQLFIQLQPLLKNLASVTPNPIFIFFAGMGLTIGPILGIMYIHRSKPDGTN